MADGLWRMRPQELMSNAAQVRTAQYRQQATALREMAEKETDKLKLDLLELAEKYDALAESVAAQH